MKRSKFKMRAILKLRYGATCLITCSTLLPLEVVICPFFSLLVVSVCPLVVLVVLSVSLFITNLFT